MKLPNADKATIDPRKLAAYCLDAEHDDGRHKARLFRAAMGLGPEDAAALMETLLQAIVEDEVERMVETTFGVKYLLHHPIQGTDPPMALRHVWIVRHGEDFPVLVTCFPERVR
ncbi:MAG: DUF6883 domain-containing protein [Dehalococcoidia bacterium]